MTAAEHPWILFALGIGFGLILGVVGTWIALAFRGTAIDADVMDEITISSLKVGNKDYQYFSLKALDGQFKLSRLPYSYKILLENLLRHEDGVNTTRADVEALAGANLKQLPARAQPRTHRGTRGQRRKRRPATPLARPRLPRGLARRAGPSRRAGWFRSLALAKSRPQTEPPPACARTRSRCKHTAGKPPVDPPTRATGPKKRSSTAWWSGTTRRSSST